MKPSPEQLAQIRRFSVVVYGDPTAVYDHHPEPESREEASELLKTLNETPVQRREPMETKVCNNCGEDKPLSHYYKGHGQCKRCLLDKQKARNAKKAKKTTKTPDTAPEPEDAPEPEPVPDQTDGNPIFPESEGHHFALASDGEKEPEVHWCLSELRNPRLSTLRGIQHAVGETLADAGTITLDEAAELAGQIADLDLA